MKVYYYHTVDAYRVYDEWSKGLFPGHFLYGATHLREHGIDVVLHKVAPTRRRWLITLASAWRILTCREHFDAIYATTFRGLEIIIFLRALGLYRHPVCVWHHQPVVRAKSALREMIARMFYRGIDEMFFFSRKIENDSMHSVKTRPGHTHIVRWGADMDYYRQLETQHPVADRHGFISTGKEMRDMPTLVNAFNRTNAPLDIYVCESYNGFSYSELFRSLGVHDNVKVHYICGAVHREMSMKVNGAACVVICCRKTNYTVGLTTVVEALALGIPVICSRNPQMPMDIDNEGCGITVEYGDVDGWEKAIRYIVTHPAEAAAMGEKGRKLAEGVYNLENCATDVADVLLSLNNKKR